METVPPTRMPTGDYSARKFANTHVARMGIALAVVGGLCLGTNIGLGIWTQSSAAVAYGSGYWGGVFVSTCMCIHPQPEKYSQPLVYNDFMVLVFSISSMESCATKLEKD